MVDVIVTDSKINFKDFTVINSVSGLAKLSKIGVLVFNQSRDSVTSIMTAITNAEYETLFYVCDASKMSNEVKILLLGIGATVVDDGFYMETYESLKSLVRSGKELEHVSSSVAVLDNFNKQVEGGKTQFPPAYLSVVKTAVNNAMSETKAISKEMERASKAAVSLFSKSATELKASEDSQREAQEALENLKNMLEQGGYGNSGAVHHYPTIDYTIRKRAVIIKEIGSVPFLHSFILGMHYYLKTRRNLTPRTIVLLPPGGLNETVYDWPRTGPMKTQHSDSWNIITPDNFQSRRSYTGDVIYVTRPTATVLETLTNTNDYDSFVILDRTLNMATPLVRPQKGSTYLKEFYAVQSRRIADKFEVIKRGKMFTSVVDFDGAVFSIPFIDDIKHTSNKSMRRLKYEEFCAEMYDTLGKDMF